jgi:hypothetical protein
MPAIGFLIDLPLIIDGRIQSCVILAPDLVWYQNHEPRKSLTSGTSAGNDAAAFHDPVDTSFVSSLGQSLHTNPGGALLMQATARTVGLFIAAMLAMAFLVGCKPPQDVDAGYTGDAPEGWWMSQTSIAAPYLFTGDFTVEFEFYLKYLDAADEIYRFAFRLVDPNWDYASKKYCSLAAYYTSFPDDGDPYYQVDQGNGTYLSTPHVGNVPGLTSGLNTCAMARTGSTVAISMNGTPVASVAINAANLPLIGYAPLVHGHNSSDEADTNFYLRKLTVRYVPGERVAHDWNG